MKKSSKQRGTSESTPSRRPESPRPKRSELSGSGSNDGYGGNAIDDDAPDVAVRIDVTICPVIAITTLEDDAALSLIESAVKEQAWTAFMARVVQARELKIARDAARLRAQKMDVQ